MVLHRSDRWRCWARGGLLLAISAVALGYSTAVAQQAERPSTTPAPGAAPPWATAQAPLVLSRVTVIDVMDGRLLPEQTVVVVGDRVQGVGAAAQVRVPSGARVVDARGKYLIPGLWDMHAHTEEPENPDITLQDSLYRLLYPIYIAHGITGIREMAERFPDGADSFRVWQRAVMAGTRVGPRAVGPSADLSYKLELETPADARRIMDSLKAAGDAFVKFHGTPDDRELIFAILREARRVGLPIVGHVPSSVTEVEIADSGLRSVEHTQQHPECWPNWPTPLGDSAAADERCAPVAQAYIRNGTWLTPTFATAWPDPTPHARSPELFEDALHVMRLFRRMGVTRFLSGTDWAMQFMTGWEPEFRPGLSGAEELVFLVEGGLTPLEAVQAATLNPAKFFNATDSLGTVAPGKLADLVLLDANPLVDINNVLKLRAVVANGRYFDRAALDALDPEGTKPGRGLVPLERQFRQQESSATKAKRPTP